MGVTEQNHANEALEPPEALIPEAREIHRRRRRRRLLMAAGIGVGAVIAAALAYLLIGVSPHSTAPSGGTRATANLGPSVIPKDPTTLAMGPNGALYIADPGRQQILKRLPDGRFEAAVGTGVAGDTGDGGLATRARIDLYSGSNMAVTPSGVLYFVQGAGGPNPHNVIREVTARGRISTVVGASAHCGTPGQSTSSVRAQDACIGGATLAIARSGSLVMLTGGAPQSDLPQSGPLLELTPSGELVQARFSQIVAKTNSGQCGGGMTYSAGVLYASCSYGSPHPHPQPDAFLVISPDGHTKKLRALYDGETSRPSALAAAPGGGVVGVDFYTVVRVTPHGVQKLTNLTLNRSLGTYEFKRPKIGSLTFKRQRLAYSMNPDGVAVDRHGNIYLASTTGYSTGDFTGIVELHTSGRIQVLWTRRGPLS